MLAQHVLDLVADFADRIERRARVLEDHRDFAPAQIAHLVFAGAPDVDAGKHHRALDDFSGAVENPHHRVGSDGFAGAGFADDAERLALRHGTIAMLRRLDDAAPGGEFHREILDVKQRLRGHGVFPISRSSCAGLTRASIKNPKMLFERWIAGTADKSTQSAQGRLLCPAMTTISGGAPPMLTSSAADRPGRATRRPAG